MGSVIHIEGSGEGGKLYRRRKIAGNASHFSFRLATEKKKRTKEKKKRRRQHTCTLYLYSFCVFKHTCSAWSNKLARSSGKVMTVVLLSCGWNSDGSGESLLTEELNETDQPKRKRKYYKRKPRPIPDYPPVVPHEHMPSPTSEVTCVYRLGIYGLKLSKKQEKCRHTHFRARNEKFVLPDLKVIFLDTISLLLCGLGSKEIAPRIVVVHHS